MRVSHRSLFSAEGPSLTASPTRFSGVMKGEGWHLHSGDDWSARPRAVLLLDPELFRPGDLLLLEVEVFNATRERPRRLVVSGAGLAPLTQMIDSPLPQWLLVPAPEPALQEATEGEKPALQSRLLLELTPLASPAALGLSPDERLLGLRLRAITPGARPLSFPLDFTQSAVREACLGAGWSPPEPSGLWSDAAEVRLTLPGQLWQQESQSDASPLSLERGAAALSPATPGALLEIDCSVLPRPEGISPLRLCLEAGGRVLLRRDLSAADPEPIRCPLQGIWAVSQPLELVLRFEGLASPAQLGINADPRHLGIFLRQIALRAGPWGTPLDGA